MVLERPRRRVSHRQRQLEKVSIDDMSMKVFVFFGPPGVGKGTQCGLLAERLGVRHVSTGSIIRAEISAGTDLGRKVKDLVQAGNLVDDSLLFSCLKAFLERSDLREGTLLLDGVPRTVAQVSGLDDVLRPMALKVNGVISLIAPVDDLVSRFAKRWTCGCGYVGSFETESVAQTTACPKCSKLGGFTRREDDKPEVVSKRMEIYRNETEPVAAIYRQNGKIKEIDGLRAVEHVYLDVAKAIVEMV
jgi:adenylate kinase